MSGPSSRWKVLEGEKFLGNVRAETHMRALDLARQTWRHVDGAKLTVRLIVNEGKREWTSSAD